MKITPLLNFLVGQEKKHKSDIARALRKTAGGLDRTFRAGNPQLDSLIDIAGQLGYDVCLMKHRTAGRLPDGLYIIDRGDSTKRVPKKSRISVSRTPDDKSEKPD